MTISVGENLTLSKKSEGGDILTEVKHVPLAEYCFKKLNDKQI